MADWFSMGVISTILSLAEEKSEVHDIADIDKKKILDECKKFKERFSDSWRKKGYSDDEAGEYYVASRMGVSSAFKDVVLDTAAKSDGQMKLKLDKGYIRIFAS